MGDINLGEMFLYFPLHESLQRFSGVDFSQYVSELQKGPANNGGYTGCDVGWD
jgi:hypothetical protein